MRYIALLVASSCLASSPAAAVEMIQAGGAASLPGQRVQSGTYVSNGTIQSWEARSLIIAATPTGNPVPTALPPALPVPLVPLTNPGGGDARYLAPNRAGYSGVVGMLMTYADGSRFVCSGSLIGNQSIATAAHCVSSGGGVRDADLVRTQIFFQNDASSNADERVYGLTTGSPPAGVTTIDVRDYIVNPNYTGEVIDQNDIAVLTLAQLAPSFAERYGIFGTDDLTGDGFNVTGYGTRSALGGAFGSDTSLGVSAGTGYRRQGDNVYDYRWGAEEFDGFFTDRDASGENFFGTAEIAFSYLSDFDNGSPVNDTSCRIAAAVGAPVGFGCNAIVEREVNIAGGDSGGGAFINGQLASINSYGLSFGAGFGDFRPGLNSSWGEYSGYVPTFIHQNFIASALAAVPEPATWAQMLLGFGVIGFAARRRHPQTVTA